MKWYNINMKYVLSLHEENLRFDYTYEAKPVATNYFCHIHNEYELLFFTEGNADYMIEDKTYHLKQNDLLLIRPGQYHQLLLLSDAPYGRYVLNFKNLVLTADEIADLKNANSVYHLGKESFIGDCFKNLKECEGEYSEQDFERLIDGTLRLILMKLKYISHLSAGGFMSNSPIVNMATYINEHIAEPLTADVIAKRFFVSKSFVEHSFIRLMKISCKQYINQKKVLYAQSLIASGTSAADAAKACSYKSYSTFYRQYKLFLGAEPIGDKKNVEISKIQS